MACLKLFLGAGTYKSIKHVGIFKKLAVWDQTLRYTVYLCSNDYDIHTFEYNCSNNVYLLVFRLLNILTATLQLQDIELLLRVLYL